MDAHLHKCRRALGLTAPAFTLYIARKPKRHVNEGEGGAVTRTGPRYHRAVLTFAKHLPKADQYEIVTHECLHAAFGRQHEAVESIIGGYVPKKHRALAWKLWDDANEADITRTARALTPVLRAMDVPE